MQGKLSGQVLLATLSVVGTRAMQVYTSAQFARARVRFHALHLGHPMCSLVPPHCAYILRPVISST